MAKNLSILTLGYEIPSNDKNITHYWKYQNEKLSLSDYDIVVINPIIFQGDNLRNSVSYWNEEFKNFVSNGGVVFVFLSSRETIKNTLSRLEISNYSLIPSFPHQFINSKGNVLVPQMQIVKKLYSTFKDVMEYRVHIIGAEQATFVSRDGNKVLGAIQSIGEGHIVYLPYIDLYECYGEDFEEDDDEYTEIELKTGHKLLSCLKEIYMSFVSSESALPEWMSDEDYFTQKHTDLQREIKSVEDEILHLHERKQLLHQSLIAEQGLSALLYETGKSLEQAVSKALYILGYTQAENYSDGKLELDQVIISPEGDRFIGECEGKDSAAINIDKFRQLNDSIYEDFQRDDVQEKAYGIIFGNPQRLSEPNIRTLTFTEKCINNARREKVGLVLTMDLFKAAKRVADTGDEEYARKCRQAIKEQLGEVVVFPEE